MVVSLQAVGQSVVTSWGYRVQLFKSGHCLHRYFITNIFLPSRTYFSAAIIDCSFLSLFFISPTPHGTGSIDASTQ